MIARLERENALPLALTYSHNILGETYSKRVYCIMYGYIAQPNDEYEVKVTGTENVQKT